MKVRGMMLWGLPVLACFALMTMMLSGADGVLKQTDRIFISNPQVADQMFTGTIKGIDQAGLRMVIQTKKGMLFIQAADEEAIRGLTPGDHVTVKMDEQGYVLAITKNAASPKMIVKNNNEDVHTWHSTLT